MNVGIIVLIFCQFVSGLLLTVEHQGPSLIKGTDFIVQKSRKSLVPVENFPEVHGKK